MRTQTVWVSRESGAGVVRVQETGGHFHDVNQMDFCEQGKYAVTFQI